jgi:hypothetical protein
MGKKNDNNILTYFILIIHNNIIKNGHPLTLGAAHACQGPVSWQETDP